MDTDLLTAEQAMTLLGKKKSTFYQEAKEGIYPSVTVKGKKLFPRTAIEAHAQLLRTEKAEKMTFDRTTNADVWQMIQHNINIYGPEDMVSYQRALEWRAINNDIGMSGRENGALFGTATIMAVDEPFLMALARDEIRESDIPLSAFRKWSEPDLSAYVATISIIHSGDAEKDAERAAFLIKNTIRWAITLHLQHDIKRWFTIGVTPEGQELSKALGFKEFLSLENGQRRAYRLDDLRQGSHLLRHFIEKVDNGEIAL
jgi:predicted DNA-binding transcriptional regulator AlpA